MQEIVMYQKLWKLSIHRLELIVHPKKSIIQAKNLVKNLLWNGLLCSGGATTLELAGFLRVSWLSDQQINIMVRVLQNWMESKEHTGGILIESLIFSWELVVIGKGWKDPLTSPYLSRLASQVQDGTITLWFPMNVHGNHWIAGRMEGDKFGKCAQASTPNRYSQLFYLHNKYNFSWGLWGSSLAATQCLYILHPLASQTWWAWVAPSHWICM